MELLPHKIVRNGLFINLYEKLIIMLCKGLNRLENHLLVYLVNLKVCARDILKL